MRIVSPSLRTTHLLAGALAKELALRPPRLPHATAIALEGPLGGGKTTFAQGFARALGVKRNLPSPTFTLIRRYAIKKGHYRHLFHIDAYRLKDGSVKNLAPLGIKEEFLDPKNLFVIEWADRITRALPKNFMRVTFRHVRTDPASRILTFKSV
ncbi:MAG: tRNA (adenosine(37)-N6)-threonylcarbamoyltransferase complex ATPase subunit type 1 TsaE [Candidatus Brennerbacteria bacterium]